MFLKMLTPSGRLGPVEGTGSLILSSVCHLGWTGRRSQPSSGFLKLSSELVWEEQGWPHCASSLVKGRNGAHDAGSNSITLVTCVDTYRCWLPHHPCSSPEVGPGTILVLWVRKLSLRTLT